MDELIPILSIETSGLLCSASLFYSDDKYFSANVMLKHSHSEKLFEIIESLFKLSGSDKTQIGSIAVSGGPGSFTGLRIGLAAAKGIATGSGISILMVPTFEAMAYKISRSFAENSEFIIANKVNKEEVYYAKFKIKANSYIFTDKLTILTNEDFLKNVSGMKIFGDACYLIEGEKFDHGMSLISALDITHWALEFGLEGFNYDFDYLEPYYLKNFIVKERLKK